MMENHRHLTSLVGPRNRNIPERCPRPLYSQDCTEDNYRIPQEYQVEDLSDIKVEVLKTEEETYVTGDQRCKEEEIPTDISTGVSSHIYSPERCPHPLYSQYYTEENHRFPQEYQGDDLADIKVEDTEGGETYVRGDQQCKEEEIPTDITTAGGHNSWNTSEGHHILPPDFKIEDNIIEDPPGEIPDILNIHPVHHSADMSSYPSNHVEWSTIAGLTRTCRTPQQTTYSSVEKNRLLRMRRHRGGVDPTPRASRSLSDMTARQRRYAKQELAILVKYRDRPLSNNSQKRTAYVDAKREIWNCLGRERSVRSLQRRWSDLVRREYPRLLRIRASLKRAEVEEEEEEEETAEEVAAEEVPVAGPSHSPQPINQHYVRPQAQEEEREYSEDDDYRFLEEEAMDMEEPREEDMGVGPLERIYLRRQREGNGQGPQGPGPNLARNFARESIVRAILIFRFVVDQFCRFLLRNI